MIIKTKILVTVLHRDNLDPCQMNLAEIAAEMDDGEFVGMVEDLGSRELDPRVVQQELLALGNDGMFFEECL
jgi:hypothetical protein